MLHATALPLDFGHEFLVAARAMTSHRSPAVDILAQKLGLSWSMIDDTGNRAPRQMFRHRSRTVSESRKNMQSVKRVRQRQDYVCGSRT